MTIMEQLMIGLLYTVDGPAVVAVYPARETGEAAYISLAPDDDGVPAVTVGETEFGLSALYHTKHPANRNLDNPEDDAERPLATWQFSEEYGDYAEIVVPEGTLHIPASAIRPPQDD